MNDRLSDEDVARFRSAPELAYDDDVENLACEVQERRAMRCETCVHFNRRFDDYCEPLGRHIGVPSTFFCADWEAKP